MNLRPFVISMLFLIAAFSMKSQREELYFRKIGNPKETFGEEVQQVCIDTDGYAWLSTTERLLRFDGKEAKRYGSGPMTRLAVDSAGRLFASGHHTAYLYNRSADRFDIFPGVRRVINDNNGNLWIFPKKRNLAVIGKVTLSIPAEPATAVSTRDRCRIYLMDTDGRLWQCIPGKKPLAVDSIRLSSAEGASILETPDGNIWFWDAFSPGINRLTETGHETVLRNHTFRSIAIDSQGNIWGASDDQGLLRLSPGMETAIKAATTGISTNRTSFVMEDDNRRLWIGTPWGAAMSRLGRLGILRHRISLDVDISEILQIHDGSLWLGLDGEGLARIGKEDRIEVLRNSSSGNAPFSKTTRMLPLGDHRILILTYGDGVFVYDTVSDKFRSLEGAPVHARTVVKSPMSETIWIGSHMSGIYGFDRNLRPIANLTTKNSGLKTDYINDLCIAPGDSVYVATGFGIYRFHALSSRPEPVKALAELAARSIAADEKGNLWIGTAHGLLRYRPHTGHLARVGAVGNECINRLEIDDRGHLWVLGPSGLYRIIASPDGRIHLSSYKLVDEIPAINITGMSICGGKIFLGGNGKFIEITRPGIGAETPSGVLLPEYGPDTERLSFREGEAPPLRVASTFLAEEMLNVVYRLSPTQQWKEAPEGIVPLDSLPAGSYTLDIKLSRDIDAPVRTIRVNIIGGISWPLTIGLFLLLAAAATGVWFLLRHKAGKQGKPEKRKENIPVVASPVTARSQDEIFLDHAREIVELSMDNVDFGVDKFATEMCLSRSGLYKRITALTGLTPNEYIRKLRLQRGNALLQARAGSIAEIAFRVGMNPRQFSKFYKEEFGLLPSKNIPTSDK